MKSARTIRTLRRVNIDPQTVGFAGFIPTGKAVRRLAKTLRLEAKVLALPEGGRTFNLATRQGLSRRETVKLLTGR